jgi:flagellin-specific chaperone FliS
MKTLAEQKKDNDARIAELAQSISFWLQVEPNAKIKQQLDDITAFVSHRMQELEVQGQNEKIEQMEVVLNLLKENTQSPLHVI